MNVLVVDDDPQVCELLAEFLAEQGHEYVGVGSGAEALAEFARREFDLILLDLFMPGMDGLEVLQQIKSQSPTCEVIIITAYGSAPSAIQALNMGAYAYINKPFDLQELGQVLDRVRELIDLRHAYRLLAQERLRSFHLDNLIAVSPSMLEVKARVTQVVRHLEPILLYGEAGTGKRFLARIIHFNGLVRESLLLQLNPNNVESWTTSESYLHSSGVALSARELPHDLYRQGYGTLVLNQIGELDRAGQQRLLTVLQSRREQLDPQRDLPGFRIIALLETPDEAVAPEEVIEPGLLEWFPHRLRVPPLRERPACVAPVAQLFFQRHVAELGGRSFYISQPVQEFLQLYKWPGNLRELEYMINRLAVICTSRLVSVRDLQQVQRELEENRRIQDRTLESLLTLAEKQLLYKTFRTKQNSENSTAY